MEKKAILAFVVCMVILVGYFALMNKFYPPQPPAAPTEENLQPALDDVETTETLTPTVSEAPASAGAIRPDYSAGQPEIEDFTVTTDTLQLHFTNVNACIRAVELVPTTDEGERYRYGEIGDPKAPLELLAAPPGAPGITELAPRNEDYDLSGAVFHCTRTNDGHEEIVEFSLTLTNGLILKKTYRVPLSGYEFTFEVSAENILAEGGSRATPFRYELTGPLGISVEDKKGNYLRASVVLSGQDKPMRKPMGAILKDGKWQVTSGGTDADVVLVGLENKYFLSYLQRADEHVLQSAMASALTVDGEPVEDLVLRVSAAGGGDGDSGAFTHSYMFFAGPKDDRMANTYPVLKKYVDYGFLAPVAVVMITFVRFINSLLHNYGVAIIILAIAVRVLLFPLSLRTQAYSFRMQTLKPKLQALQEKHKNSPDKLRQEHVKLFKEHKISPLGCVGPMILQLMILIPLFQVLRLAIDFRQAPFVLWIQDLSQPDNLAMLPILNGFQLNLLPILMTVAWLVQSHFMPTSSAPEAQQQQKMMKYLPIIFGVMLYSFSAGLSLYWLVGMLVGIFEQKFIKRILAAKGLIQETPAKQS